jgi:hypothetical protein
LSSVPRFFSHACKVFASGGGVIDNHQIKLDFKDVLIRPKRSTLKSRSEVSVKREFTFKHSKV